jgi:hypothetical protein
LPCKIHDSWGLRLICISRLDMRIGSEDKSGKIYLCKDNGTKEFQS